MSEKPKIVWVYGSSAAGKETFIRFITTEKPPDLVASLGWEGRTILTCKESIEWVAQYDGDPLGTKRADLPEVLVRLAQENPEAIILIKGQDLDLADDRVKKVKKRLPAHDHEIIFLQVSLDELAHRLKSKSWYTDAMTQKRTLEWLNYQLRFLRKLSKDFTITVVEAETGYKRLPTDLPRY